VVERALELRDLKIADARSRRRPEERTRVREALVDYFYADNRLGSTPALWRACFNALAVAARAGR